MVDKVKTSPITHHSTAKPAENFGRGSDSFAKSQAKGYHRSINFCSAFVIVLPATNEKHPAPFATYTKWIIAKRQDERGGVLFLEPSAIGLQTSPAELPPSLACLRIQFVPAANALTTGHGDPTAQLNFDLWGHSGRVVAALTVLLG